MYKYSPSLPASMLVTKCATRSVCTLWGTLTVTAVLAQFCEADREAHSRLTDELVSSACAIIVSSVISVTQSEKT